MAGQDVHTASVGAIVETADGETLGWVSEARGDYLCVDPDQGDSFWLVMSDTGAMSTDRIQMEFTHDELDRHVVPVPPGAPVAVDDTRSQILPDEGEQRVAMLEELAGQRRELSDDGVAMPGEDRTVGEPVEDELARKQGGDRR